METVLLDSTNTKIDPNYGRSFWGTRATVNGADAFIIPKSYLDKGFTADNKQFWNPSFLNPEVFQYLKNVDVSEDIGKSAATYLNKYSWGEGLETMPGWKDPSYDGGAYVIDYDKANQLGLTEIGSAGGPLNVNYTSAKGYSPITGVSEVNGKLTYVGTQTAPGTTSTFTEYGNNGIASSKYTYERGGLLGSFGRFVDSLGPLTLALNFVIPGGGTALYAGRQAAHGNWGNAILSIAMANLPGADGTTTSGFEGTFLELPSIAEATKAIQTTLDVSAATASAIMGGTLSTLASGGNLEDAFKNIASSYVGNLAGSYVNDVMKSQGFKDLATISSSVAKNSTAAWLKNENVVDAAKYGFVSSAIPLALKEVPGWSGLSKTKRDSITRIASQAALDPNADLKTIIKNTGIGVAVDSVLGSNETYKNLPSFYKDLVRTSLVAGATDVPLDAALSKFLTASAIKEVEQYSKQAKVLNQRLSKDEIKTEAERALAATKDDNPPNGRATADDAYYLYEEIFGEAAPYGNQWTQFLTDAGLRYNWSSLTEQDVANKIVEYKENRDSLETTPDEASAYFFQEFGRDPTAEELRWMTMQGEQGAVNSVLQWRVEEDQRQDKLAEAERVRVAEELRLLTSQNEAGAEKTVLQLLEQEEDQRQDKLAEAERVRVAEEARAAESKELDRQAQLPGEQFAESVKNRYATATPFDIALDWIQEIRKDKVSEAAGKDYEELTLAEINKFGDEIQITAAERKAVIDETKKLYDAGKLTNINQIESLFDKPIPSSLSNENIENDLINAGLIPGTGGSDFGLPEDTEEVSSGGADPYKFVADNLAPDEKIIGSTIRADGGTAVLVERTNPNKPDEKITYEAVKDPDTGEVFYEWGGFDTDEKGIPQFGSTVSSGSKPSWTWGAEGAPGTPTEQPEPAPEEPSRDIEDILRELNAGSGATAPPVEPTPTVDDLIKELTSAAPTPTPAPTPAPTPTPAPEPAPTPEPTPAPTPAPEPTTAPTPTPQPSPEQTPTPSPEPTPTPTPAPTPAPSPEQTPTPTPGSTPPSANVTPQEVEKIVNDALKSNPGLTKEDVQSIVSDAVKTVPNLTADQVKNIVGAEVAKIPVGASPQDVQSAVDASAATQNAATAQAIADAKIELAKEIQAAKDIGLQGDAALQAGLNSLSAKMGTNQADLLNKLNATEGTLRSEFSTGIGNVAGQVGDLSGQVGNLSGQVAGLEGQLTAQGKAFAGQLMQQGMDYATALQTAIGAQSALFGTQIGGVQAEIAANEARRIADQQAAAAAAEAQRQADQKAAAERDRQANIRGVVGRAQTRTQDVMQQLESMQRAGLAPQPTPLVESSAGFDLSDPLNTGFFSGFQNKKAQQNQQPTTKIAAGGYIDDLLAENMTADDLLNLLR